MAAQHFYSDAMQVISVLPDLHLMMSVNSLLSPPSEASDSVPTVAIFLYRSHGYVWHGRAEIRITFTYTSPLQTPATEHIPSAWARQLAVANSLKSNTSILLSHDYVTSLIQKVVIISERGKKKLSIWFPSQLCGKNLLILRLHYGIQQM